jgi:hypothetical protein
LIGLLIVIAVIAALAVAEYFTLGSSGPQYRKVEKAK